ncbi:ATP synthase subunit delta, chloroplastic [Sesamum angolense]|uniref:ATP synthase subunit delta, chloroplastic n=1 Tax=Sesamum angolense TaxID=2727404 RepID=A0AAE1XHI9_9LAMI|nr:ATP synthase subunit delta, chloroplastic [Sesamum angolense]
MDTLSGSVSTFHIPSLHPKSHQLKSHLSHLIASTSTPITSKLSNKATIFTAHNNFIPPLVNSSQSALPLKQSSKQPESHHKATSTGYAVALLDVARCNNVLEVVERDVKRLSKWLCNDQLSAILLVEKNKVEMLSEVLMEFGRIYDDLSGSANTQVVFVSCGVKIEEKQILGIARTVHKLSGAAKVKVRQLVGELPSISFAP